MVVGACAVVLDTLVINVALPTIMTDLEDTLGRAQLVISIHFLAIALVIPLTGFLAYRLGAKCLYAMRIIGFTLTLSLCWLGWDINSLIIFQCLRRFAGGITMP